MDFEQILARLREGWNRLNRRLGGGTGLAVLGLIGIIAVIWLATGIYTISPGENAASASLGPCKARPSPKKVCTGGGRGLLAKKMWCWLP